MLRIMGIKILNRYIYMYENGERLELLDWYWNYQYKFSFIIYLYRHYRYRNTDICMCVCMCMYIWCACVNMRTHTLISHLYLLRRPRSTVAASWHRSSNEHCQGFDLGFETERKGAELWSVKTRWVQNIFVLESKESQWMTAIHWKDKKISLKGFPVAK